MNKERNISSAVAAATTNETTQIIEYAHIHPSSCDDGPGVRTVLFLQGCSKSCPGCHNTSISRRGQGTAVSVGCLIELITKQCRNHKLTISGGEPLEQLPVLLLLLTELRNRGFDLCLYTGWDWEQVPSNVRVLLDTIKVGSFQQEFSHNPLHFVGSSNQRMYRLKNGQIVEEYQLKEEI